MPRINLKPEVDRFWEKVDKRGPNECWNWLASRDVSGHGRFQFYGKYGKAHRFSYLLHKGPIPEGMEVCHTCHNSSCVNPNHLKLGTHIDNMRDLAISGRRKGFRRKIKRLPKVQPSVEERFWSKVNKSGPIMPHMTTPCWTWMNWLDKDGRGRISVSGKLVLAHRFSYELFNGPIPDRSDILHDCNNHSCVNPHHLSIKTYPILRCVDCGKMLKHHKSTRCRSCSKIIPFDLRFWGKVDKNGPTLPHMTTPCWVWIGRPHKSGYGYFDLDKKCNRNSQILAHRLSWEIAHKQPIPDGLYVLHHCDNRSCINPDHLFLGTYKDNSDDMISKGRAVHLRGENHPCAKLTQIQVKEIRDKFGILSRKQLAREYNVSQTTIERIINGKSWKQGD